MYTNRPKSSSNKIIRVSLLLLRIEKYFKFDVILTVHLILG